MHSFERAAKELVKDRFLLPADAQALVEQAKALDLGLPKN
jgi:hypothetical protein